MRRHFLFVCAAALLSAPCLFAQGPLLPSQFGKWSKGHCGDKPATTTLAKEAAQFDNDSCQYSSSDPSIVIWEGSFRDPSSAYEVYTAMLRPGMMPTNLGQSAAFDKDGVIVQVGKLVLSSTANISKDDLSALVKSVEPRSEKGPLPPIRTYLPGTGRMLGSERYALGPDGFRAALRTLGKDDFEVLTDAAGFNSGAEAMFARYQTAKGGGVLLLLEYPTPQLAEQHIHHLEEVLPAAKQAGTVIERKGSLLSMVLSPSSEEYAKNLRDAVDYETQVTWNEASQTATDPPITSIMVKIFIGTGVFMVAAVVLGIAFGGVRVVTKRFFPGKVFDRPNQMEVLQLGLSGKRIDPSDFY
ncbi:MAG TPA: DUF6599 family protein [Candidatus Acidoferrum sp.]|nr:DUF6599 family protein [Candidatus Acidoferrum sp.]